MSEFGNNDKDNSEMNVNASVAVDAKASESGVNTNGNSNINTPPARRSLRPGGGLGVVKKLNEGPAVAVKIQKKTYQRDALVRFKPDSCNERYRPQLVESYGTIMIVEANGQKVNLSFQQMYNRAPGYGHRQKEKSQQNPQTPQGNNGGKASPNVSSLKKGDKGSNSGDNLAGADPAGWSRGTAPPKGSNKKQNKPQDSEIVTPTRLIPQQSVNVVDKMAHEVLGILNKITPNTSGKLTQRLCEVQILNNAMLDRMIQLVFEKAIREISFANLYAEMCYTLEQGTKNLHWEAIKVVHDLKNDVYFSIKDLDVSSGTVYGPFPSRDSCIDEYVNASGCEGLVNPVLQKPEYLLLNDSILKIGTNNGKQDEYFAIVLPFSDITQDAISSKKNFSSFESALEDSQKKNTFRRRLLVACQQEFDDAVSNKGKYGEFIEMKQKALADLKNLTGEEREQQLALIEEKEVQIRQRKFGMLRFIGELVRKNMLKSSQMFDCIDNLLAESDQEGIPKLDAKGKIIWKAQPDEEDLEALCKLLMTVGNTLESNSTTNEKIKIDEYFKRLQELTKGKSLNSRIKFSVEEVISLRSNNWQARREQEGPSKIDDIHKKILKEQQELEQHLEKEDSKAKTKDSKSYPVKMAPLQQRQFNDEKKNDKQLGGFGGFGSGGSKSIGFSIGIGSPSAGATSFNIGSSGTKTKAVEVSKDDIKVEQKVNTLVEEYILVNDLNETLKEFKELPVDSAISKLLVKLLEKYAECNSAETRTKLLKLADSLQDMLISNKSTVQSSISKYQPILNLCDYEQDVKDAPELLGTFVRSLIKSGACDKQFVLDLVTNARKQIALDEYAPSSDSIEKVYISFLSSLEK